MKRIENRCVDCGFPCMGDSCPNRNVQVIYCDGCGCEDAKYNCDGLDYCAECAEKYLNGLFDELTILEKAKLLNEDVTYL